MGHYRSEMACPSCHETRCRCEPEPDALVEHWVVTDDYRVVTAAQYTKSLEGNPLAMYYRMSRTHHARREDAQAQARRDCERALEDARQQAVRLERLLHERRPWEDA